MVILKGIGSRAVTILKYKHSMSSNFSLINVFVQHSSKITNMLSLYEIIPEQIHSNYFWNANV